MNQINNELQPSKTKKLNKTVKKTPKSKPLDESEQISDDKTDSIIVSATD